MKAPTYTQLTRLPGQLPESLVTCSICWSVVHNHQIVGHNSWHEAIALLLVPGAGDD